MPKRITSLLLLFVVLTSFAFAEYVNASLVDIIHARRQITDLQNANGDLTADTDTKQQELDAMNQQISSLWERISVIDAHLADLSSAAGRLHSLMISTADASTKRRLLSELEFNRQQQYDLTGARQQAVSDITGLRDSRYTTERRITKNNVDIRVNEDRINYLERCISYTESQLPEVDNAISAARNLANDVEAFLQNG